jgi:hypothetical protein
MHAWLGAAEGKTKVKVKENIERRMRGRAVQIVKVTT